MSRLRFLLGAGCIAALTACSNESDGALDFAIISSQDPVFSESLLFTEAEQYVRAATALGLVARNAQGEIIPGLAERWIVTDDGLSFIFRLREGTWPDGQPLDAQSVQTALRSAIRELKGTPLEIDLVPIEDVRAMAGRVVELRLSGPFPTLLQLLAQPELALNPAQGAGDMAMERQGANAIVLRLKPPDLRNRPTDRRWRDKVRPVHLTALPAQAALGAFDNGQTDAVLGGTLTNLPLVDIGPLSRGTIRIDPAIGLFGLYVQTNTGPLADGNVREAITMAIDRDALIARFGVGGWAPTTRIVNPGLADDPGYIAELWIGRTIEDLRTEAVRRIEGWQARQDAGKLQTPILSVELGEGLGKDILFSELKQQLARIGVTLTRATNGERGDMVLVDQIARYAAPRWFLNQFNCSLNRGLCDADVDYLVELATAESDLTTRATLLAEAEAELSLANVYIPFATPLRWSLVRGNVIGFVPNRWAFHPLPPMAERRR